MYLRKMEIEDAFDRVLFDENDHMPTFDEFIEMEDLNNVDEPLPADRLHPHIEINNLA